jgi:hypothetical protein
MPSSVATAIGWSAPPADGIRDHRVEAVGTGVQNYRRNPVKEDACVGQGTIHCSSGGYSRAYAYRGSEINTLNGDNLSWCNGAG